MAAVDSDSLLALLRRTTDEDGWLEPLLADPDSEALIEAGIAMYARLGRAVTYNGEVGLISDAPGGSPGLSTVTLSRSASGTAGAIPTGYRFTDANRLDALAVADVVVGSGVLTVDVPVATVRQTEMVNTEDDPGYAIAATNAVVLATGGASALIAPPGDASVVTTTFQAVAESTPILGGTADYLSKHGQERGQQRQSGEATEAYRARVRNIPDAVSPIAVADGVQAAAAHLGISVVTLEPFEDGATPSLKTLHGLGSYGTLYASGTSPASASPAVDFFDDPGRLMLSLREATCHIDVVLQTAPADPTSGTMFADALAFFDDPVLGYPDVGTPTIVKAQVGAIVEEVNRKRAGGVSFDVVYSPQTRVDGAGATSAGTETVVFTLTPPGGTSWLFQESISGLDSTAASPGTIVPSSAYYRLRLTFADASTFETAPISARGETRLTADSLGAGGALLGYVTKVEGIAESDGAATVRLGASVFVLAVAGL